MTYKPIYRHLRFEEEKLLPAELRYKNGQPYVVQPRTVTRTWFLTVAGVVNKDEDKIRLGFSICHPNDTFIKATGRKNALSRIAMGEYVEFKWFDGTNVLALIDNVLQGYWWLNQENTLDDSFEDALLRLGKLDY